jgi:hypothetical protein
LAVEAEGFMVRIEIRKDESNFQQVVGLCPHCRKGPVRLSVVDGQLIFECFLVLEYPDPCFAKFEWSSLGNRVVLGVLSVDLAWAARRKVTVPPLSVQARFDVGAMVVEDGKTYFASDLEPTVSIQ